MAWNPSPKIADCREIAKKWNQEQVIIITFDIHGLPTMATYGKTPQLCQCAEMFGNVAFNALEKYIEDISLK